MSSSQLVVSLFDYTGIMVKPWADAGFHCETVDIRHEGMETDGFVTKIGCDVREYTPSRTPGIVFAFPPCTDLATSGARHFKEKGMGRLIVALEQVEAARALAEQSGCPFMIENPVSTLSTYWREPDYVFDPNEFGGYLDPPGDAYLKRTCLWIGGGFVFPYVKWVEPVEGSKFRSLPPTEDRGHIRSVTPAGFAQAVFEHNYRNVIRNSLGGEYHSQS